MEANVGLMAPKVIGRLLAKAAALARPAISNFKVGAVARGGSGQFYLGANLEFPGHGPAATIHAEQAAIVNAWTHGETRVTMLAVSAAPCGHCRQFLYELRDAAQLPITVERGAASPLGDLLPAAFGPADLGVSARLLDPSRHNLSLATAGDQLANAALDAADQSYAPYTGTFGSVALQLADGSIYAGRTIENAAYNPGLPPLQGALVGLALAGRSYADIRRAVLVEAAGPASHRDATASLLAGLAPAASFSFVPALIL